MAKLQPGLPFLVIHNEFWIDWSHLSSVSLQHSSPGWNTNSQPMVEV